MNKEYYLRFSCLLLVVCTLLVVSSCTYDYFEDETNYVVYVPKADKDMVTETYRIEDLSIFIYNDALYKERHSTSPFGENPRSRVGNFNFRLYPGNYSVYCFTNLENFHFENLHTYDQAKFNLEQHTDGTYKEPSAIYVDYKDPTINFPGPVVTDTAFFEQKYVGRICVAFKNLSRVDPSLTYANVKEVKITASGIGVTQYLSMLTTVSDTRSSRNSTNDRMRLTAGTFDIEYKDFEFGIQNYYYPSPDLSGEGRDYEPISLMLNFVDHSDNILSSLTVDIVDENNVPIVLHMNETLIVEVDGNKIHVLRLDDPEAWNPQIEVEEGSRPGEGGVDL